MLKNFEHCLEKTNLSNNTICSYVSSVKMFLRKYKRVNKTSLLKFKAMLIEKYKAKTVNIRIQGINKFLDTQNMKEMKLSFVKIQQKTFLENVISDADYEFFKNKLWSTHNYEWYFIVRFLGATGARVSELIQFKYEHLIKGFIDLYTKAGKVRRIYIPILLKNKAIEYYNDIGRTSGYLFLNKNKNRITTRGISHQLKKLAESFNMNLNVIYPHSFRHRFAKNFLQKNKDLALLADLMGHESIETTRIYLRRTSEEQQEIVDKIVVW